MTGFLQDGVHPAVEELLPGEDVDYVAFDPASRIVALGGCSAIMHDEVRFHGDAPIWMMTGLRFTEDVAKTRQDPVLLEDYLADLPKIPDRATGGGNHGGPRRRHVPADVARALLDEFPWLSADDIDDPTLHKQSDSAPRGSTATQAVA